MPKVLLIDDHPFLCESLSLQLQHLAPDVTLLTAHTSEAAIETSKAHSDLALVLLDLSLAGEDGLNLLSVLRTNLPKTPVAIFSAYNDSPTMKRARAGGAAGFICKSSNTAELLAALRTLLAGQNHWPAGSDNQLTPRILENATPPIQGSGIRAREYLFSPRQIEVLDLLAAGYSNREIAERLYLSEGTVKQHVHAIYKLLGVTNRAQAISIINRFHISAS